MPDLSDTIETEAGLPQSSTADGQSSTGRTLKELRETDIYLSQKAARRSRRFGIINVQIMTPGAGSDCGINTSFTGPCGGC